MTLPTAISPATNPAPPRPERHMSVTVVNLRGHVITPQSPQLTSGLSLGVAHSVGSDQRVVACPHDRSVTQSSATALKPSALRLATPAPTHTPVAPGGRRCFPRLRVSPRPARRRVGAERHAASSGWLLWLSNRDTSVLDVFFVARQPVSFYDCIFRRLPTPKFIYPFTHRRTFWLLPRFCIIMNTL